MNGKRAILHSDLNSFYASVETMLNPALRGKAVAVCGATEERHGIVLAKSDLAKKAGVKTGMVNWEARQLCKDLILVPPQYDQYLKYSKLTREIYERYTDLVEPFGMDECFLDITASQGMFGTPMEIAEEIRKTVKSELGLTVSIGVSFNKVFAKLGSDMRKPDAITEITPENFKEKVWPLSADEMIYVGRATIAKLRKFGINTLGQLAAADPRFIKTLLGKNGLMVWSWARGEDQSRVAPIDFVSPVKSIGHGITCVADLENDDEVRNVMLELSQDVGHRLRVHGLSATGVQVSVRGNNLGYSQFQCKIGHKTQLPNEIAFAAFELFKKRYRWSIPIRAVCVRAINLIPKNQAEQISLFDNYEARLKRERAEDAIEDIRRRFGKHAVTYCSLLGDLKMPDDGRDKVKMPGMMYG